MLTWQLITAALVGVCIGLLLVDLRRVRSARLVHAALGCIATVALWALGDFVTGSSRNLRTEQLGIAILYTGSIFHPAFWWQLSLLWAEHVGSPVPATLRRSLWVPFAWAGAHWLVMLTNPWHRWLLTPVVGDQNLYGPAFAVLLVGNTALSLAGTAVILRTVARSRGPRVWRQGAALVLSSAVILVGCWVYVFFGEPVPHTTQLVLAASAAFLLAGMHRDRLFGLLPTALPVLYERDPDALLVVELDGHLLDANPRARELLAPLRLGPDVRLPDALVGLVDHVAGASLDDADPAWRERFWEALGSDRGALCSWSEGGAEGPRWLLLTAHDVPSRTGRTVARAVRARDLSALMEAQKETRRARRLESVAELAGGVAHDFNNVLGALRGHLRLLREDAADRPELARRVDKVLRVTERAEELAQQLRLYAGGAQAQREVVDVNEIVLECAEMLEPGADPAGRWAPALGPGPIHVRVDPTQLRQVLLNLLVNAREALAQGGGGEITVHTGLTWLDPATTRGLVFGQDAPAGDYAFLRVSDTGPGLSPAALERIFEPYYSTKDKGRGTGLSTVLGIARAHHAPLAVESRVGRGAAFTLYLPPAKVASA